MNQEDFKKRVEDWKNIIIEAVDLCEMPHPKVFIPPCIPRCPELIEEPPSLETLDKWYRPDYNMFLEEVKSGKRPDLIILNKAQVREIKGRGLEPDYRYCVRPYDEALKELYECTKKVFKSIKARYNRPVPLEVLLKEVMNALRNKEALRLELEYEERRNKLNERLKEAYSQVKEITGRLPDVFYHEEGKHSTHTLNNIDTVLRYINVKESEYKLDNKGCTTFEIYLNAVLEERIKEYLSKYRDKITSKLEEAEKTQKTSLLIRITPTSPARVVGLLASIVTLIMFVYWLLGKL